MRSVPAWLILMASLCSPAAFTVAQDAPRPNLVMILTDNHGPWTLGCYGNPDIRTPHIDRLAAQGMLFTRAFANNAVCSPTRATLLTGLMPSQHGVHCYLGGGGAQVGPGAYCTIAEFSTLPKQLQQAGYVCGLSGKWHLGGNMQPQEGFTSWITKPHGGSAGFYDQEVIENQELRKEPRYLTELWTEHAVTFLEQNQQRPFFLLLAYNGPYGLGQAMREPIRNGYREDYEKMAFASFPREAPHPWGFNYPDWVGDLQVIRKYAAEVSGIDDGVGSVLQTLQRLNLEENTIVVFLADQGLAGGHSGFWGMGDHTRPLTAYDWTMSIPLIVRWPGKVPANQRCDRIVANYDIMPTLLDMLHLPQPEIDPNSPPAATWQTSPGRSFAGLLQGRQQNWEDVVYFEFENVRAIRTNRWKYIERIHQAPNELYDLHADPGERRNLIDEAEWAATRQELQGRLTSFFEQYAAPQWDLWNGGASKTSLITGQLFGIPRGNEGRMQDDQPDR
jgi:arylsulfatase A-like enzyme